MICCGFNAFPSVFGIGSVSVLLFVLPLLDVQLLVGWLVGAPMPSIPGVTILFESPLLGSTVTERTESGITRGLYKSPWRNWEYRCPTCSNTGSASLTASRNVSNLSIDFASSCFVFVVGSRVVHFDCDGVFGVLGFFGGLFFGLLRLCVLGDFGGNLLGFARGHVANVTGNQLTVLVSAGDILENAWVELVLAETDGEFDAIREETIRQITALGEPAVFEDYKQKWDAAAAVIVPLVRQAQIANGVEPYTPEQYERYP